MAATIASSALSMPIENCTKRSLMPRSVGASKPWSTGPLVLVSSGSAWQPESMSPQVFTPPMSPTPPWSRKKSAKPARALALLRSESGSSRDGG